VSSVPAAFLQANEEKERFNAKAQRREDAKKSGHQFLVFGRASGQRVKTNNQEQNTKIFFIFLLRLYVFASLR
jgi:hypothetical protein